MCIHVCRWMLCRISAGRTLKKKAKRRQKKANSNYCNSWASEVPNKTPTTGCPNSRGHIGSENASFQPKLKKWPKNLQKLCFRGNFGPKCGILRVHYPEHEKKQQRTKKHSNKIAEFLPYFKKSNAKSGCLCPGISERHLKKPENPLKKP